MSTKDSGKTTNALVMVNTLTRMERHILETGKMICKMDKEWKFGPRAHDTKALTKMVRNKALESTCGLTVRFTPATGTTIK